MPRPLITAFCLGGLLVLVLPMKVHVVSALATGGTGLVIGTGTEGLPMPVAAMRPAILDAARYTHWTLGIAEDGTWHYFVRTQ